jgi:hypothetical protein
MWEPNMGSHRSGSGPFGVDIAPRFVGEHTTMAERRTVRLCDFSPDEWRIADMVMSDRRESGRAGPQGSGRLAGYCRQTPTTAPDGADG